ncbi:SubName: Full=Uncharacterized protein {ECO:0000313/EMBL:CCA68103.1} [Serendipita indica DSM 11827]|nr:SubName: Full=Uncharacterized protein {ECO:0000313/EMBL:CCA68103.1} [Serendipita indica DSM 11827]
MAQSPQDLALQIEALRLEGIPLWQIARNVTVSRYLQAAAVTILCYDTLLTLREEVRWLWPMKWEAIKVGLYINRLIAITFSIYSCLHFAGLQRDLSKAYCRGAFSAVGLACFCSTAICNWIILCRTNALLGSGKENYRRFLILFYAIVHFGTLYIAIRIIILVQSKTFYSREIYSCAFAFHSHIMRFQWILEMSFEATLFSITIYKLYELRSSVPYFRQTLSRLFYVLFRDGASYYVILFFLRIANVVAYANKHGSLNFIALYIQWSIMTVFIFRIQLNLLDASHQTWPEDSMELTDVGTSAATGEVTRQFRIRMAAQQRQRELSTFSIGESYEIKPPEQVENI